MVDPHLSKRETACALAILNHVNEQLGACPLALPDLSSKQRKIFMYISPNSRVEGCVLAELISSAYRVVPDKEPLCRSDHAEPAVCGISRIWVAQHARQRGIATQMLKAVQQMFVYGCCIKPEQIAFTQPTAAGRSLAERFFKRKDFLVYAED
ncbi:hypothetical protein H4R22_004557 [Coemansia sp. RSA 1290]|nr:hypothetical protein H4R22_004557 [Coemansia sp. RSA 1290]